MTDGPDNGWFASCPRGVEPLLARELAALGAAALRETVTGVHFDGPLAVACRACLWSRLANRVLWPLATVPAADADALYRGLRELPWGEFFDAGRTIAVDFSGTHRAIRDTRYGAQRCKDAVVDWFTASGAARPSVDRADPDVRINVRLAKERARVALDLSGASLHRRGYRTAAGAAPLKENLAAAILVRADWPGLAARGGALIDPLCGAGTLLVEGAMMAADIAPGLARERFGFESLHVHDRAQWGALVADARGRAERGRAGELPEIRGYDASPRMIDLARENIARAGLDRVVRVSCRPLSALVRPTHRALPTGLVVANPPYGERLGERRELPRLYRELGERLAAQFQGWQAAVFTADRELGRATGLRSYKQYTLYNGAIATSLLLFDLQNNTLSDERPAVSGDLSAGAQMLVNRLRKNRRRLAGWVRRENVQCYRLYDADMPEYAVAVDVYGDHLHVAEYRAPAGVDETDAQRRLDDVLAALPAALDVPRERIALKQRTRQRGPAQYAKQDQRGEFLEVREGRARLWVNLYDYLDTGLFLDHRPLRLRLAAESEGRDFLNLFSYTGSATVHAALGGARSTASVDTSKTYLDWLRRNLSLNAIDPGAHRVIRADCLTWLEQDTGRYDLVLLDPPSFSNSKSRDHSFDVVRDHPRLLRRAMALLRPAGRLYFSCNRRGFRLDDSLCEQFHVRDITAQTIDPDFARSRGIHQCWTVEHTPA